MSLNKNTHYIYLHLKPCGEVFYVGIGKNRRAYNKKSRNSWWKKVVNKHGYEIQIIKNRITKEEACELEKILISWYGRRDLGKGTLVNLTDGGETTCGRNMEDWQRKEISKYAKTRVKDKNPNFGNKWSKQQKERMSEIKKDLYKSGQIIIDPIAVKEGQRKRLETFKKNPGIKERMAEKVSNNKSKYDYLKIDYITGEILEEYKTFLDLRKKYPDVGKTVINSVCNGYKVSYLGFLWRYRCKIQDEIIIPKLKNNKGFKFYYEIFGKKYLKLLQASKYLNISYNTLENRVKNKNYKEYLKLKINNPYIH